MDIYSEITSRIISELENGIIPWEKPWIACGNCLSHVTGKPYSLLNQMLLGRPGEYLTFNQCKQEGGHVRKGEKSRMVVFWKWLEQEDEETGEVKEIPYLRYYSVFHIDQCEGVTAKHTDQMPTQTISPDLSAEQIITNYLNHEGVALTHEQGDRAYYSPSTDSITLPDMAQFSAISEYYSTAFHELTHSTGHSKRLNRLTSTAHFGSEDYGKEELVAEIGASALVNHAGLETTSSFRNNAAYIQNWLQVLKGDKRFIISAAGKAEKAVNLILG